MKNKIVIAFILVILFVLVQATGVMASGSYPTLKLGSRGSEVAKLQQALKDQGYYNGVVDGIYGPITREHVIKFQKANGLVVDGIAGKQTLSALYNNPARQYPTLKLGSRGDAVIKLQQELIRRGYLNSKADGIYGPITRAAVMKYQSDAGLIVDGIAGKQTQSSLYSGSAPQAVTASRQATSRNDSADSIYWLSRIIEAEAGGEPYAGKVAVGNVVLNRVNSKDFPDTIYNVIFENYKGIPQFSPVADGTIYNTPSQESINAAKDALNGSRPAGSALYFFNPNKSPATWIVRNKQYITKIGNHVFYG